MLSYELTCRRGSSTMNQFSGFFVQRCSFACEGTRMGAADRSDHAAAENHLDDAEWVTAESTLTFLQNTFSSFVRLSQLSGELPLYTFSIVHFYAAKLRSNK